MNQGAPARYRTGQSEKDFTLIIARRVAERLKGRDIVVRLTRNDDRDLALLDRVKFANQVGADLMVSLHLNSSKVPGPSGPITFLLSAQAADESSRRIAMLENEEPAILRQSSEHKSSNPAVQRILLDLTRQKAHSDSLILAKTIQHNVARNSPFKGQGVRQAPFYVLMGAAMPAVVAELGFINHPQEGRFVTSEKGMNQLAQGVANGIIQFKKERIDSRRNDKGAKL